MKDNVNYKSFSLKNSILKSHYDNSGRYGDDHSIKRKIICLIDALLSMHRENISHERFDYLIVGDDSLISIICGLELSLMGYKTAILPKNGNLDENNKLRESVQNKLSYEAISMYLNAEQSQSATQLINNLIKRNKKEGALPLYFAVDHDFHSFDYKGDLHLIKSNKREKQVNDLFKTTSVKCKRIKFFADYTSGNKRFYNFISSKKIIHTSTDNLMKINKNDKNTLLVGISEKDISKFKTYSVADRLAEIIHAINAVRSHVSVQ